MAIPQHLREKLERLDIVPDNFVGSVAQYQDLFFSNLVEMLGRFDRQGGNLVLSDRNLSLIPELSEMIRQSILGASYLQAVRGYSLEFDNQAEVIAQYLLDEFENIVIPDLSYTYMQEARNRAAKLFTGQSLKNPIIDPIENLIVQSINTGSAYTETVSQIRNLAKGYVDNGRNIDGLLLRYSKQLSYDSFAIADRAFTNIAIQDVGVQFYQYAGGTIKDTRDFCASRNGKFFHHNEIAMWGLLGDWQGKFKGTDESTIFVYAGGYNCRHSIVPRSNISVPKPVLVRNINSGNFNPSNREKELLGLVA